MKITLWDILATVTMFAVFALSAVYMTVFIDPNTPLNPFPPPTMPAALALPTATATLRMLPPTWTATPPDGMQPGLQATSTEAPTATGFVLPSFTMTFTSTATPTNTPTVTKTPTRTPKPSRTPTKRPTRTKVPTKAPTEAPPAP